MAVLQVVSLELLAPGCPAQSVRPLGQVRCRVQYWAGVVVWMVGGASLVGVVQAVAFPPIGMVVRLEWAAEEEA